ncbi:hypothetical protein TNCV_764881 [Trichonephila clavipes]|nr:hypothetical protein TNCV_764881 [Trichonephila clavipes]
MLRSVKLTDLKQFVVSLYQLQLEFFCRRRSTIQLSSLSVVSRDHLEPVHLQTVPSLENCSQQLYTVNTFRPSLFAIPQKKIHLFVAVLNDLLQTRRSVYNDLLCLLEGILG